MSQAGVVSSLPANLRQGAAITLCYFLVYYIFIGGQVVTKKKLRRLCNTKDKKFDRYGGHEGVMLGWDRTVGNMLEQMGPFLGFFWLNIMLSPYGGLPLMLIATIGWLYVLLRSLYPVLWFNGGGGPEGTNPLIWTITYPMYVVIIVLFINAIVVTCTA